jgi:hypothetical protein
MKRGLAVALVALSTLAASTAANAISIDIGQAVVGGGAGFIGDGSKIKFDANIAEESATFTLPSIPGQQYAIEVTGHNDSSASFFRFFIDADGPGPGAFLPIGSNFNFGSGFSTVTLPTFTDLGASDFFRIVNDGTGNTAGQITGLSLVAAPSVTPLSATPLPAAFPLFASGLGVMGLLGWRRKRKNAAAA